VTSVIMEGMISFMPWLL